MRYSRFLPVDGPGGGWSRRSWAACSGSNVAARQDEVSQQYRVFTAALAAIDREYVDEVPSDRLVYSAIDGMLKTLDPHSSFFDPGSYAQMRERQDGRYYGLGITIQVIDGDITVMSIFEGSPAYKKGLRRVDVIARISGRGRQGLDERAGGREAERPEGHQRQHLAAPAGLRRPDRSRRRTRRGHHRHGARRVHGRQARPATSSWETSRRRRTTRSAQR